MSPAFPAAWLLFGLAFAMAAAHFMSLPWSKSATVIVYSIPVGWCLLVLHKRKGLLKELCPIDTGFAAFILAILVSAFVIPGLDEHGSVWRYIRFLPFLVITPYLLGRLMRLGEIELFSRIVLVSGLLVLPLLLLDRLTSMGRPWRLPIFGLDHGPLLVGGIVSRDVAGTMRARALPGQSGRKSGLAAAGIDGGNRVRNVCACWDHGPRMVARRFGWRSRWLLGDA